MTHGLLAIRSKTTTRKSFKRNFTARFEKANDEKNNNDESDDCERSARFHLAQYYSHLIDQLYLLLCQQVLGANSVEYQSENVVTLNFKRKTGQFKSNLFIINNLTYILQFMSDDGITVWLNKLNPGLVECMQQIIDERIEQAFDMFAYVDYKWQKLTDAVADEEKRAAAADASTTSTSSSGGSSTRIWSTLKIGAKFTQRSRSARRDELVNLIRECIHMSGQVNVFDAAMRSRLKEKAVGLLAPIVDELVADDVESLEQLGLSCGVDQIRDELTSIMFALNELKK